MYCWLYSFEFISKIYRFISFDINLCYKTKQLYILTSISISQYWYTGFLICNSIYQTFVFYMSTESLLNLWDLILYLMHFFVFLILRFILLLFSSFRCFIVLWLLSFLFWLCMWFFYLALNHKDAYFYLSFLVLLFLLVCLIKYIYFTYIA